MPRGKKKTIETEESNNGNNNLIADILGETMLSLRAKEAGKKNSVGISNAVSFLDDIPESTSLNLDSLALQYAFGVKAFKPGTIIELIGPEHVGKTTMVFTLLGMFMKVMPNISALYVCTEGYNKLLIPDRIKRCLSSDPLEAEKLMHQITRFDGHPQKETLDYIDLFCKTVREKMTKAGIPESTPILVAIDTVSKLIPKTEAISAGYGDGTARGLGESSKLDFSNMMAEWARKRADFTERYNVFMILVSHQNTKINMTAMPGVRPTPDALNKTKIGGHAIDQTATVQFTLTRIGSDVNKVGDVVSHLVKLTVVKNSRGADRRAIVYRLRINELQDDANHVEKAIDFDYGIPELFAVKKILGTRMITKSKFTCTAIDASEVSREEFVKILMSKPDLVANIAKEMQIYGYDPTILDPSILKDNIDISEQPVDEDESQEVLATPEQNDEEEEISNEAEEESLINTDDL